MAIVAVGATLPQKVLAVETGTVPIVKAPPVNALTRVKDNGTIPIVGTPSTTDPVAPPPGGSPDDPTFNLTITVNAPVTQDTVLELDTTHPDAVNVPATVTVPAGSSTVTTTISVVPGYSAHHKSVKIFISANGTTIHTRVRVHYHGEQD